MNLYSVDKVDITQELKKQAEGAALAFVARSAHCSISSATSTLYTHTVP